MRRVVITGLGLACPLGTGVKKCWEALLKGSSGVGPITLFEPGDLGVKISGEVSDFTAEQWVPKKDIKKMGRFIQLSLASATQAVQDSGIEFEKEPSLQERTGVLMGVGMGSVPIIEDNVNRLARGARVSSFFIPAVISNSASGHISIKWGLKGPNFALNSACASGSHAIGEASLWIKYNRADVVISGGAESVMSSLAFHGFHNMRALSIRNQEPEKASRPWDKDRDGFVLSEGAAVVVLEELEHAKKRGAKIYAEVVGYGQSSDAWHIVAPEPEGLGASSAMTQALTSSGLNKEQVNYINAHGTSTPAGDIAEVKAVKSVFKDWSSRLMISSTKSMTGHTLGAAGAVETVFSMMCIKEQKVPPTINLENSVVDDLDLVPGHARDAKVEVIMNNSFGFGGTNACLIFKKL